MFLMRSKTRIWSVFLCEQKKRAITTLDRNRRYRFNLFRYSPLLNYLAISTLIPGPIVVEITRFLTYAPFTAAGLAFKIVS